MLDLWERGNERRGKESGQLLDFKPVKSGQAEGADGL